MNNIDRKPSEILSEAIEILAGGACWIKEELWDGGSSYCLLGAVSKAFYGEEFAEKWHESSDRCYPKEANDPTLNHVNDLIKQATGGEEGYELNDRYETEFEDVKNVLCTATKLALAEEETADELAAQAIQANPSD